MDCGKKESTKIALTLFDLWRDRDPLENAHRLWTTREFYYFAAQESCGIRLW